MDTRADGIEHEQYLSQRDAPVNGASQRTNGPRPTTSEGARYLEELRASWRAQIPHGVRLFNPDETPKEAEQRIRETLAGLTALSEVGDDEPDEPTEMWDQVMDAIKRPRLQFHDVDLHTSDS